jgi:fumarylacetoacetase
MGYGIDNLPYASVIGADGRRFAAVRYGDQVLDLGLVDPGLFADGSLDGFLAAGPPTWGRVRAATAALLGSDALQLVPVDDVTPVLGFTVSDYVDFYACEHHAANAGRIFRPAGDPLPPSWKHLPIGYHGRSGSVVASGSAVRRPSGVLGPGRFGPSVRLDFEAELAFVVGVPGSRIPVDAADEHVFGVCLLNDWSARDIQGFESVPLGPFLGKSFATSISPWITPVAALAGVRIPARQDPSPVEPLRDDRVRHGLHIDLEVRINGQPVSRPPFAQMYWTYAQMLAHLTSNGAAVRTGDVFASGTVSGAEPGQRGCLLELTWNGTEPLHLDDGSTREWLHDGDEVVITATAGDITLGEVSGEIIPG